MVALTSPRDTATRKGNKSTVPVAAGQRIYVGSLVALNSGGYAHPAASAANLIAWGRALTNCDNREGSDGDASVMVERGCFLWANDTTTPVTRTHVGKQAYMVDDQTVTAASSGKSEAGKVIDLDAAGVWVLTE